jgi:hypothetical protein
MNPVEQTLRRVDRYQQQHAWLAVPFAIVRKFGDDKGGALTTVLAYNAFFALHRCCCCWSPCSATSSATIPAWSSGC